ncbi:hypothetical protein COCC4DRAFT_148471 [Bipolaris maydis ATCC 48331]|uniref:Uncharacterized protein n=1 Tax=Cochliobolus heterostrophus (strain C4 / ATCC 48331 / race T) TaxID=665024 RepID=N4WY90_COCH4|nr:hypothetical protein COCC4DRAFT_148471 [Bipolaris maydis ATCC 48331]
MVHTTIGNFHALDPVRSPFVKYLTGGLVVRWVTTGESPLSYVFVFFFLQFEFVSRGWELLVFCMSSFGIWNNSKCE